MDSEEKKNDQVPSGQRMLAAIMFTDIAGFSIRMGEDEERTVRCVERDLRLITKLCGEFHGRVLKRMGDGILAVFLSAVGSVECAQEIQRQFAEQARGMDPEDVLHHRIGIHLGDVFVHDEEVMGDGVNIAARLQDEAPPGGICISQALYGVVRRRLNIKTVHQGAKHLKNIREQVHIYQLIVGDMPSGKAFAPFNEQRSIWWYRVIPAAAVIAIIAGLFYFKPWGLFETTGSEPVERLTEESISTDSLEQTVGHEISEESESSTGEKEHVDSSAVPTHAPTFPQESPTPWVSVADSTIDPRKSPIEHPIEHEPEAKLFRRFDVDQDGKLSWSEIPLRAREQIMRADFNKDDAVTWDEIVRGIRLRREKQRPHPRRNP